MITVVVPVMNEEENIESLVKEIVATAEFCPITEIVYVDDASTDGTLKMLQSLKQSVPMLRILTHSKRAGQSAALLTGIRAATNDLVATLDGDGQNDPADIPLLYNCEALQSARLESHYTQNVMVAGQRLKRNDNYVRRVTSRIANNIRSALLKDNTRDTGCSLKLFRRSDYLALPYFNHMHRFLPALMMREGVQIVHVDVSHRARTHGVSKYGTFDRLMVGITDIFGVRWLQSRASTRPVIKEI